MRKLLLVLGLFIAFQTTAIAQDHTHSHGGEPTFWDWWDIHGDHESTCDNMDAQNGVHQRAWCDDEGPNWRYAVYDCYNFSQCYVSTRVICPGKQGFSGSIVIFVFHSEGLFSPSSITPNVKPY